ncbi:glycine cleavage T C-terminal barrel domain-containing protein [Nocardioides daphniae]|uniref:glycine cleavage T C-terminal barrel domain-containing protein n=1 Tax=Nocardioides daphniae TaxID=402297 RepID=UPI0023B1D802|nr:glycine cleavage T C-terminal barrel domain-containing protein [Nocardioides daphniae]
MVCRTGYTGERGYELIVRNDQALAVWDALLEAGADHGIVPCGLGARDTLRTEMGYPLHGQDISLETTPLEGGVRWAVGWSKERFWGKNVLAAQKEEGAPRVLRGLLSTGRAIPRPGMSVTLTEHVPLGDVTSGTFSPTLKKGIGLALLPTSIEVGAEVGVDVRGRREIFTVVKPPFVDTSVREG